MSEPIYEEGDDDPVPAGIMDAAMEAGTFDIEEVYFDDGRRTLEKQEAQ